MIKKLINNILSYFRTIYVFESKKNKKSLTYKDLKLKRYNKFGLINKRKLKDYINQEGKKKRFSHNQSLLVLYWKKDIVSVGWMYKGAKWKITEVNEEIYLKNKILLYDFFTFVKFRNKGFYSKILNLIKNIKTKKTFLIYCLKSNAASKKGILNSKFVLIKKVKKNV